MSHSGSAEGAARLAKTLGYVTSGESLRQLQRQELMLIQEPRVIGLDEFSLQKTPQITYGTIIVDEERQRPIDVLSSDQTERVAAGLTMHPGMEIITRDRDQAYAAAARLAVPGAIQVGDRFHLVKNAAEALKTFFKSHNWKLLPASDNNLSTTTGAPPLPEVSSIKEARQPKAGKLARREAVKKKVAEGESIHNIALEVGIDRKTVRRYLSLETPPVFTPGQSRRTKIAPFLSLLQKMWEAEGAVQ